ncbi:MAG: DUF5320 domain-containing protein [Chloroflexi bacterium]|nr:DUF5320 domain-containing protein [Chloroflexota bacterium]
MPGRDRTGPLGTGPIGRGLGPCGGQPGSAWGRGRFHRGGGAGWGRTMPTFSPEDDKELLQRQKSWLESQLTAIAQRLQGLSTGPENE